MDGGNGGEGWVVEAGTGTGLVTGAGTGAGWVLVECEGGPESASESLLDGVGQGTVSIESYVSKKTTKK